MCPFVSFPELVGVSEIALGQGLCPLREKENKLKKKKRRKSNVEIAFAVIITHPLIFCNTHI